MPRVVYDPSASSIVVDLLLESTDDRSTLLIPVVLDTGASITIVAVDIMARLARKLTSVAERELSVWFGHSISFYSVAAMAPAPFALVIGSLSSDFFFAQRIIIARTVEVADIALARILQHRPI